MAKLPKSPETLKTETRLAAAGRRYAEHGMVNPAVYHASTVTFPTAKSLHDRSQDYVYGRRGTPTSRAIEEAIATLENGYAAKVCPSGLSAISSVLQAFLKTGDHLLMTDSVYAPARHYCDTQLSRFGIETEYYDPLLGAGITKLIRPNTRMIYCESPGSQTMEVQDLPALAAAARKAEALLVVDNTWSGGLFFNAFKHGADISVHAATKYIVGHSDAMLGAVTCSKETWETYKEAYETIGLFAGPDDMYLALRGLKTIAVRMERQMKNALDVASWLRSRPEVETVLYPALPNAPGHTIWKRDFTGASGLFSIVLKPAAEEAVAALLDDLELFAMGYSWGGFESLIVPFKPHRTATEWTAKGPCLRLHIGLEHPDDLKADLEAGFARLKKAAR